MGLSDNYYHALDKGYSIEPAGREDVVRELGMSIKDIGISAPPMRDALSGLKAKIFQGASRVELGFMGRGGGSTSQGSTVPEQMGQEERQDIRELASFNKITLSVHATPMHGSLSGLGEHGFSDQSREQALHEIERAIDFAADTTQGGAVVIHTGEFPRPIADEYGADFMAYPTEKQQATLHVVDAKTGEIQVVKKDRPVFLPEYETDAEGNYVYMDKERTVRKVQFDPATKEFKVAERGWDFFEKERERWNKEHPDKQLTTEQVYIRAFMEADEARSRGLAHYYMQGTEELPQLKEKLERALDVYKRIEANTPENERWTLKRHYRDVASQYGIADVLPPEYELPSEYIQKEIDKLTDRAKQNQTQVVSFQQDAERIHATKERMMPIKDYALERTADSIARAALFAMKKSQYLKSQNPNAEPIFVAPENIYPEQYGSHPEELKLIIRKSRQEMEKQLHVMSPGMDDTQAAKLAQTHIKATFDIGHANIWRKYFNDDPAKSIEQNDQAFKGWLVKQVKGLIDEGIIAHVHVSDNFGYEDTHVVPGQGRAPIKEIMEELRKAGIKDVIVEPGESDVRGLLGGWKQFGSSIYGLAAGRKNSWTEVEHSYFGRNAAPYFLYGESAPDNDQWTLWSGIRLE